MGVKDYHWVFVGNGWEKADSFRESRPYIVHSLLARAEDGSKWSAVSSDK